MSKSAAFIVLIMALISGLLASVTVMKYIKDQQNKVEKVETVKVVVAKEQIPAGTAVLSEQVEIKEREKDTVPVGTFDKVDALEERVARTTIYPGEVILQERLITPGTPGGLPAMIPEGYRAITLRVDDTKSVAGFVRPGHYVDILVTADIEEENGSDTKCKVILQNVKVLATGQEIEVNNKEGDELEKKNQPKIVPTVTLLVTLEQAERVTLASNAGIVQLVLRSHTDQLEKETKGVSLTNLIARNKKNNDLPTPTAMVYTPPLEPTKVAVEKKPAYVIQVYRGKDKTEVTFD